MSRIAREISRLYLPAERPGERLSQPPEALEDQGAKRAPWCWNWRILPIGPCWEKSGAVFRQIWLCQPPPLPCQGWTAFSCGSHWSSPWTWPWPLTCCARCAIATCPWSVPIAWACGLHLLTRRQPMRHTPCAFRPCPGNAARANEEGQADLLSRLQSIAPSDFEQALRQLGLPPSPPTSAANKRPNPKADAQQFLMQVMMTDTLSMADRIEAAKALLQHGS